MFSREFEEAFATFEDVTVVTEDGTIGVEEEATDDVEEVGVIAVWGVRLLSRFCEFNKELLLIFEALLLC